MKSDFLFPRSLRIPGWIITLTGTPVGIWLLVTDSHPVNPYSWLGGYFPTIFIVVFIIGLLFLAFSREKIEDEYITKIRASSLVWAIIVNYIVLMTLSLFVYGLAFLYVAFGGLFLPLVLYIVKFRLAIWKLRKPAHYEE